MTLRLPAAITLVLTVPCLAMPAWAQGAAGDQETPRASAAPSAEARSGFSAVGDYVIGPEDVLDIQVWKNPELSRTVPVRPDGKVSLPLVNDVQAAGMTPTSLREYITQQLEVYVPSPEVSVIVREVHSVKVSVIGAVRMPGHYEVKGPATILDLIARAQGFTEFASTDRIVVLRQHGDQTTRVPFDYGRVAESGDQQNFYVQPGDIIVVP